MSDTWNWISITSCTMVIYFGFLKFWILTKLQVFDGQYCSGRLRVSSGGCNQKLRFLNLFDSPLTDSNLVLWQARLESLTWLDLNSISHLAWGLKSLKIWKSLKKLGSRKNWLEMGLNQQFSKLTMIYFSPLSSLAVWHKNSQFWR